MGRLDIASVLEKNGIDFKHSDNSKEYRVCCPSCGDGKYRLWLNSEKLVGICYRCTEGGSIWKFLKLFGIQSVTETKKTLELPKEKQEIVVTALPDGAVPLWNSNSIMAKKAIDYLVNTRGLLIEEIESYRIHYCYEGKLQGNVIIPIFDLDGTTLLGWQARRFIFQGKKSLNPVGSNGRLFGLPQSKGKKGLLITEGPFDQILAGRRLAEADVGVIALLGHSLSVSQAGMIRYLLAPEVCWILLDPDAFSDQQKIAMALRREGLEVYLCPKQRADPDELSQEELLAALDDSKFLV